MKRGINQVNNKKQESEQSINELLIIKVKSNKWNLIQ